MVDISLKEKDGILENRIADETFKEITYLNKKSKPKRINLYGANPVHLVGVMIALQDRFRKARYKADIFIGSSKNGEYSVDVGYYLELYSKEPSHPKSL